MRTAFISDIHANLSALEAVLAEIGTKSVDEIVCLGDIVGYGADPNDCAALVRERCSAVLLGNHDAAAVNLLSTHNFNSFARVAIDWTAAALTPETRSYLLSLPLTITRKELTLVHATPYEPNMWYYITSLEEAAFNFQHFTTPTCLIGHTHIPLVIVLDKLGELYVHQSQTVNLKKQEGSRLLINVGSVGQPRDRNPAACYAILDDASGDFRYFRVPYDIDATQAAMRSQRLPEFLVTRLADGR